ncbi:lycopene cyclase domain-containing protein [Arthrobacter sp. zg-Y238]|uniref:lycopene cyclase domain-containing protein n=1 Tax=Arthrobacter sp. zg-Y238 TaxID=2964614 RepID=UPI002107A3FE|nr:lycopene cyclase domain-containing protein [Arthrobacter sp. zg-Y238]MCQ1952503.1 lycopene cyclase domain-containing protein [Arthrobacter sp. zg-Y238]
MGVLYLLFLLLSLGCMVLLDHRFRLFFFANARRAAVVLAIGLLFFTAWDLAGIGSDIFYRGETPFMLGLTLAPHLPVEEIFFLAFLCYLTMVVFGLVQLVAERTAERAAERTGERAAKRHQTAEQASEHPGRRPAERTQQ